MRPVQGFDRVCLTFGSVVNEVGVACGRRYFARVVSEWENWRQLAHSQIQGAEAATHAPPLVVLTDMAPVQQSAAVAMEMARILITEGGAAVELNAKYSD